MERLGEEIKRWTDLSRFVVVVLMKFITPCDGSTSAWICGVRISILTAILSPHALTASSSIFFFLQPAFTVRVRSRSERRMTSVHFWSYHSALAWLGVCGEEQSQSVCRTGSQDGDPMRSRESKPCSVRSTHLGQRLVTNVPVSLSSYTPIRLLTIQTLSWSLKSFITSNNLDLESK